MIELSCRVNGAGVVAEVDDRLLLADFIRHTLGLRGTRVGCEHGVCGSCTVLVDDQAVRSCLMFAGQIDGRELRTVESLASADCLHPLQRAFHEHHALQCGACTSGLLMTATELYESRQSYSEAQIREAISGSICRCTGYEPIVAAIAQALEEARP